MATYRSTRRGRGTPIEIAKWVFRILGGSCSLLGIVALIAGDNAAGTYASLVVCGLVLLAASVVLMPRGDRQPSSPPTRPSDPWEMSAADLSAMTPPSWEAIPPSVVLAAQPDMYFHNCRDRR